MNLYGSIRLGRWWIVLVSVITRCCSDSFWSVSSSKTSKRRTVITQPGCWDVFGWGSAVAVVLIAFVVARIPWREHPWSSAGTRATRKSRADEHRCCPDDALRHACALGWAGLGDLQPAPSQQAPEEHYYRDL